MKTKILFCLIFAALFSFAADRPATKQLAGPPSDFLNGLMAPVDFSETGIRSRSALISVGLDDEGSWQGEIVVDKAGYFAMIVLSGSDENWKVELRAPNSRNFEAIDQLYNEYKRTTYGLNENVFPGDHYTFEDATPGTWAMKISVDSPINREGFILYGSEGPHRLYAHQIHGEQLVGNDVGFLAYGLNADTNKRDASLINNATMVVSDAYGTVEKHVMYDDGAHNDSLAGDGIYGATFTPSDEGNYNVQVIANGQTPEGYSFLRTAEHTLAIIAPEVLLRDEPAQAEVLDGGRLNFALNVDLFEGGQDKYRTFAEVWGQDITGEQIPVAWIGGMVTIEKGQLNLPLDGRWISLANANGPFELRNIRIEDPDHFIPVARSTAKAVLGNDLPQNAFQTVKRIDNEMLMGQRPERNSQSKAGHTLLLVHGYCSGDAWGPNMGNFSSATKFTDYNQNRSHDEFANIIYAQGSSFDGYGIVAHSQGGCASLHLYSYYWSGLDTTTSGSRLIQSVGTPYQGTALAGNLAALGEVFGAGCGVNTDLTYSGAASWLSGIPTWARNDTNYFTTSFEEHWYYDYCHLATDLFLSDPEDGTTEKAYGQLPSGVNRGHKYGWCHTTSMRDPGQCTDSSRNSSMSANAAR